MRLPSLGVALPAFACALASHRVRLPWARPLALVGLLAGLLPATCIVFGEVRLNPSSLPLLFGIQALWYLGVAGMLFASSRTSRA